MNVSRHQALPSMLLSRLLLTGLVLIAVATVLHFMVRQNGVSATTPTEQAIERLQQRVEAMPGNSDIYVQLANAYLQRARETEDSAFYARAEETLQKALELEPDNFLALTSMGVLALGNHEFVQAKEWASQAIALRPNNARPHGVMGDAHMELGEYEAAVQSYQTMVNLEPNSSSYVRVSYIREIMGDMNGAIEAMQQAVAAAPVRGENAAWVRVMLGNLYFNTGRIGDAERQYEAALDLFEGHFLALEGLASVRTAQGRHEESVQLYERLVSMRPDVGHFAGLGDALAAAGNQSEAEVQYERALDSIAQLGPVDRFLYNREVVLFYTSHDLEPELAVQLAAEELEVRKDIYGYDAYAWALHQAGRNAEAAEAMRQAMRFNTQDPMLFYHEGMIHHHLGHAEEAKTDLQHALSLNPKFGYEVEAQQALDELAGRGHRN